MGLDGSSGAVAVVEVDTRGVSMVVAVTVAVAVGTPVSDAGSGALVADD